MGYEYRPRDAAEALPRDISNIEEFIESKFPAFLNTTDRVAEAVNMKPMTNAVEAAHAVSDALKKLTESLLGAAGDKPSTGTVYGCKALADSQAELQN